MNKTIVVDETTKERLESLGKKGDTFDHIIKMLLDNFENNNGGAKKTKK